MKILIVIPYEFYPPKGGGALRCFYAVKELSKYFDVSVVVNQKIDFSLKEKPDFLKNIKYYFTGNSKINFGILRFIIPVKILNFIFFKLYNNSFNNSVNTIFIDFYPVLKLALKEENPDVVIFENLESLFYLSGLVRDHSSKIKIIYEAHNVDYLLWNQIAEANKKNEFKKYSENALKIESTLSKYTDCVICFTRNDESILRKLNSHNDRILFSTVACGVDIDLKLPSNKNVVFDKPKILFCGSLNYQPNIEGIRWFYDAIMPILRDKLSDFEVIIIGNCESLDEFQYLFEDPNINLIGRVDDVAPYYHNSMISIVPLLSGSGIRLKITESMSFGCPVVSTTLGAEGIEYDEDSIFIADTPEQFSEDIILLLQDVQLRNKLRMNGRSLVEQKYDWKILMADFRDIIYSLK